MNPLSLKNLQMAAVLFGIAASSLFTPTKLTAQLFWDQNGATEGTGGLGNWDLSSSIWRSGSSTGTLGIWSAGNNSVLGGTAGTVTLSTTGISATGLDFQTTGYALAGTATDILTLTDPRYSSPSY
jgi:fibronectin-binding autotransporter adhesin